MQITTKTSPQKRINANSTNYPLVYTENNECTELDHKTIAVDHIKAAIESLSNLAESDEIARDSIANLAVVLLDLQN